ncbi:hypothetical protein NP233_g11144 [Leucocoprinus birnbaumii]|uniref:Nephrocystin 3-like N-terminal domain-containing protein n=1 Tax=Leucocoprinus birnbaumii TaxID=56174 RepID=A0AAD5VN10_9AGAR|nr:hypothetical protein NP233_g11144 [Leucocoprinus birnbaumii]
MSGSSSMSTSQMFGGAHHFSVNNLNQTAIDKLTCNIHVNNIPERPGLDRLLAHSMRDAFHDSSSRWPPPRCHYDSRQELRSQITDWATGRSAQIAEKVLWMYGPFGVGKSAIAQTCADTLAGEDALGGSLFLSRPNNRNNPDYIFPSLAFQLALNSPEFANLLEQIILRRQTLLTAARYIQFEELIVKPLREAITKDPRIQQWTIILDGLDEVDGTEAQCDIIDIVVASIRSQTTPFRWLIVSRPEPHIQRTMRAEDVIPYVSKLDIPLSPKNDHEILTFFTKELGKIRKQYNLPSSWCSEANLATLVKFANGLWVVVDTIVRFIGSSKSLGPTEQLRLVLSVTEKSSSLSANPLARMDLFYDLIMRQIPANVISTIRKILLLNSVYGTYVAQVNHICELANILGLTREGFFAACDFLQSVLSLKDHEHKGKTFHFYHTSFMEYMSHPERSTVFWIYGDCLEELQQEVIRRINDVHSRSKGNTPVTIITYPRPPPNEEDHILVYCSLVCSLFQLCDRYHCVVSPSTAALLINVQFSRIAKTLKHSPCNEVVVGLNLFKKNLPDEYRDKIIRQSKSPLHMIRSRLQGDRTRFILGRGKSELVCWADGSDLVTRLHIIPFGSRFGQPWR